MIRWLAIGAVILLAGCAPCSEIQARDFQVLRVIDGDTFVVHYDGEDTSARIHGIDAPEMRTEAGPASKAALVELIDGKTITIEFPAKGKRDNFGRLLVNVYIDNQDVGDTMLSGGHAMPYRKGQ